MNGATRLFEAPGEPHSFARLTADGKSPIAPQSRQLSLLPQELTVASQAAGDCVPRFWGRSMETDAQASMQNLRAHVERLAGEIGERNIYHPRALQAAASYIERQWEQQGYIVERLAYDVSGVRCLNLEITRSGGARQREILLMGAHYDTVIGSPGANDNASGVSALLEMSRLFAGVAPALTVRFVAFVNEEAPFFTSGQQGSMVYAEAARRRGDDIELHGLARDHRLVLQ